MTVPIDAGLSPPWEPAAFNNDTYMVKEGIGFSVAIVASMSRNAPEWVLPVDQMEEFGLSLKRSAGRRALGIPSFSFFKNPFAKAFLAIGLQLVRQLLKDPSVANAESLATAMWQERIATSGLVSFIQGRAQSSAPVGATGQLRESITAAMEGEQDVVYYVTSELPYFKYNIGFLKPIIDESEQRLIEIQAQAASEVQAELDSIAGGQ